MQFIDLQAQYQHLKQRIDGRVQQVFNHGKYIMGPEVQELEENLAEFVGVKHAISCGNGTDALQLCLMTLAIEPGDVVFCPTFTFFATAEVISLMKAIPVFVDSDLSTFNICPIDLEEKIKKTLSEGRSAPKAIIAVDLFGLPANYSELERIASKYNLVLIEDAAQGFGGSINGRMAGSFGDIATTSFFPAKPLGCYGDGGAIFTNSDEYAELVKSYRIHGKGKNKYDNIKIGMNSRLDTVQAAILLEKLVAFPAEVIARNRIASFYNDELKAKFNIPCVPEGFSSSWAQYTLISSSRNQLMGALKQQDIPTMIYYEKCMHEQTAFNGLGYQIGDFPVSELFSQQVFSLPMHPYMEDSDMQAVVNCLIKQN